MMGSLDFLWITRSGSTEFDLEALDGGGIDTINSATVINDLNYSLPHSENQLRVSALKIRAIS